MDPFLNAKVDTRVEGSMMRSITMTTSYWTLGRRIASGLALGLVCMSGAQTTGVAEDAAPVTITEGDQWVALRPELEIEPGSALDFSSMELQDAPAGKYGRVIAREDGQFAFAKRPKVAQRFYGVNFCFSAQYLSHAQADRLADRLVRLGYNAVRIHHYEQELCKDQPSSTQLNPEKIDQLDYFLAALAKRGIYYTTDLFVSRSVKWEELGINKPGAVPMNTYKILVPIHEGAFANWCAFSRALLNHLNPYSNLRYADDPALGWLSMINEGNYGNYLEEVSSTPEWVAAWNEWLSTTYGTRASLASAWKDELKDGENFAQGTVEFPKSAYQKSARMTDCARFFARKEQALTERMRAFLRTELGCQALLTDWNAWVNFPTDQGTRTRYDYVDDHYYIDHPEFIEKSWRLPSKSANTSPILGGASGGRPQAFTRLYDRPFTITEYNYSGPGRFRGVGGILTGAMGAFQGWGGIWRFAYSHGRDSMFDTAPMNYFDMAGDPLSQASERASLCLFLRGDLRTAPHSVAVTMTSVDLAHTPERMPMLAPKWHWAAWVTRIGMQVFTNGAPDPDHTVSLPVAWKSPASAYLGQNIANLDPYALDNAKLMEVLREKGIMATNNPTDPARSLLKSETGEILIDAPNNILVLDTPRTAGGYAPEGQTVNAPVTGVKITMRGSDATVWVSAVDNKPIATSRRLLLTHLTDLQNSGIKYKEAERKTLLAWGGLPHLVRVGQAEVTLPLKSPAKYQVWALSPGGKRLAKVATQPDKETLTFTADVAGDRAAGARMLYEIVRE